MILYMLFVASPFSLVNALVYSLIPAILSYWAQWCILGKALIGWSSYLLVCSINSSSFALIIADASRVFMSSSSSPILFATSAKFTPNVISPNLLSFNRSTFVFICASSIDHRLSLQQNFHLVEVETILHWSLIFLLWQSIWFILGVVTRALYFRWATSSMSWLTKAAFNNSVKITQLDVSRLPPFSSELLAYFPLHRDFWKLPSSLFDDVESSDWKLSISRTEICSASVTRWNNGSFGNFWSIFSFHWASIAALVRSLTFTLLSLPLDQACNSSTYVYIMSYNHH